MCYVYVLDTSIEGYNMRLSQAIWTRFILQCRPCVSNRLIHVCSANVKPYQCFSFCYKLNDNTSSLVKEVTFRLPYSTNADTDPKNNAGSEKDKPQSKKKKEIKVYITLLGADGNIISVTTVEDASKLALRRNMRLVKAMDLDPKSGRAVYKLLTESDYLKGDIEWEDSKSKKGKENSIKGNKVVSFSSTTAEHDVLTKAKMMKKWLGKKFEVRIVITGDLSNGENVFKVIEKEIGTNGRIVQKRTKGQDIRFQILPPKKIEPPKQSEPPKKAEGTETVKEEI